jgi:hypothetical protein
MFAHGQIVGQILLMDPAKRTQKVARGCPQPFTGVGLHLADPIAIVIACPFFLTMAHGGVATTNAIVTLPFIRVTGGVFLSVSVHVSLQCLPIGMMAHPQPTLFTFAPYGPDDGRAIVVIRTMTAPFVGAAPRRVTRIAVFVPFFPPRSETSPRFPSRDQATPSDLTCGTRWPAGVCATEAHTGARARVLPLTPSPVRLCKSRGLTTPPGAAPDCCPQRGCPYRGYSSVDSGDSGNRRCRTCADETRVLLASEPGSLGSASLWGENVSRPQRYFRGQPVARLWEKSFPLLPQDAQIDYMSQICLVLKESSSTVMLLLDYPLLSDTEAVSSS